LADLIKATVLFVFGFVILANLGDALDKKSAPPPSRSLASSLSSASMSSKEADDGRSGSERPKAESETSDEAVAISTEGSYAQVCARFDPIAHPEQVIDILEYASETTGTPVDVLYAVWQKETGFLHGDGRMSGGCDLKSELTRRDGDAGTRHWQAMIDMADVFGWKARYGENLERMTCSCPKYRVKGHYGGCCGPFQFSGNEVAHQYAVPLQLDPMTFCGGALIAGWELKKHHDNAFRPDRNWGKIGRGGVIMAQNPEYSREEAAWRSAMSRYYGADTGGVYGRTAVTKWKQFHEWYLRDQKQPGYLVTQILNLGNTRYSLRRMRAKMSYASD